MLSKYKANLYAIYSAADKQDKSWYNEANEWCHNIALRYNVAPEKVMGVVAVLSPRLEWRRNKLLALRCIKSKGSLRGGCLGANIRKANAIYHAENFRPAKMIGGKKVRAFYANIRRPQTSIFVTIDTHAANAAAGKIWVKQNTNINTRQQKELVRAYKQCAKVLNHNVADFQAIIWEWWRKNKIVPGVNLFA